jgi:uncharacterized protein YndB with AHSA1/START domain
MSEQLHTHNMAITRHFDAPVQRVWKAWSDANEVKRWWGPHGFTAPVCEMDFREGGTTLVCMRAPVEYGGQDMYNTWSYTKIVPMERIEFIQRFSDKDRNILTPADLGLPPGIPMEVPHVITMKAAGDNKTEFSVTEYGYRNEQVVAISKSGMEQVLDKLAATLTDHS